MEKQLERLFEKMENMDAKMNEMREEFKLQINIQTEKIAAECATTIEKATKLLLEENKEIKNEVSTLNAKVRALEKDVRKNNLILHGIKETEQNYQELQKIVLETFNTVSTEVGLEEFDKWELNDVYRLGKKQDKKCRPILVKLTLTWRRLDLLRNNKRFPTGSYVTEDYPRDVLKTREELKTKLKEEIKKGNSAKIRYDRLVIKEKSDPDHPTEKRKRSPSKSPNQDNPSDESTTKAPNKINKTRAMNFINRSRTNSLPGTSKQ